MIRTPYLIQRAEIIKPLVSTLERLSNAVKFEYMGSAEFEFGALPQSLRNIDAKFEHWQPRVVKEIHEPDGPALRVYSAFNDEEFEEYKQHLLRLRDPKAFGRTKELTYFEEGAKERSKYARTDFWWDIDNDTMFSFNKPFMKHLPEYVANSLAYMKTFTVV